MAINLVDELKSVSEQDVATIQLIGQSLTTILLLEKTPSRTDEQDQQLDTTIDSVLHHVEQIRPIYIARVIQDFDAQTTNGALSIAIFERMEKKANEPFGRSLTQQIIDYLAVASLYEYKDPIKAYELNEDIGHQLSGGRLQFMISTLEEVQTLYSQPDQPAPDFALSASQMRILDQLILKRAEQYLDDRSKKDDDTTQRLVKLLDNVGIKDDASILKKQLNQQLLNQPVPAKPATKDFELLK